MQPPELSVETAIITLLIITCIYLFILTPIQLYYGYKFWQYKNQNIPFFTKRHPPLVIFNVIIFNIYPTLIRPCIDYLRLNKIISHHHPLTRGCLNIPQLFAVIITIRLWLLYYDYNHCQQSLSRKWASQITKTDDKLPWTLQYKWLGNLKILSLIATALGIFLMGFVIGGCALFPEYLSFIQMLGFLYFGIMLLVTFKIRVCRDHLSIQREYMMNVIALICSLFLYLAATMVFNDTSSNIRVIATNIFIASMCYAFSSISTYWTVDEYYKTVKMRRIRKESVGSNKWSLEEILATKHGFDLFANHLVKEFSIENLFFLFEIAQIKQQSVTNQLIDAEDIGITLKIAPNLMDELKRRDGEIRNIEECKNSMKYIMKQYIYSDAEYSLNISARNRDIIQIEFDKMDQMINNKTNDIPLKLQDAASLSLIENSVHPTIDFPKIPDLEIIYSGESVQCGTPEMPKKAIWLLKDESMIQYIQIFDVAIIEIKSLVETDSLIRFYQSDSYKTLVQNKQ